MWQLLESLESVYSFSLPHHHHHHPPAAWNAKVILWDQEVKPFQSKAIQKVCVECHMPQTTCLGNLRKKGISVFLRQMNIILTHLQTATHMWKFSLWYYHWGKWNDWLGTHINKSLMDLNVTKMFLMFIRIYEENMSLRQGKGFLFYLSGIKGKTIKEITEKYYINILNFCMKRNYNQK